MNDLKKYLSSIKTQLIVISIIIIFKFLIILHVLPNESTVLTWINSLFIKKGLIAICIASIIENLVILGTYFPGSIVILTAMALTTGDPLRATYTFLCIAIPSLIAHIINFFLGTRISNPESRPKNIFTFLILTLWHPYFAAISAYTLGSSQLKISKFLYYFAPVHIVWNIFWALSIYYLGNFIGKSGVALYNIFYLYIFIWTLWGLIQHTRKTYYLK